jgi:hypothetical protein
LSWAMLIQTQHLRIRLVWLTLVLQDERTPLHWAASGGHLDITEYLILQKAQVDAPDDVSINVFYFILCAST